MVLSLHLPEETEENHEEAQSGCGQCPDWDFNEAPPAYKSESLPTEPSHTVFICFQLFV
jgi:hypothetical protein